jgi:transposase
MPLKIQKLERTIRAWFDKICNYHLTRVSKGPTEALNSSREGTLHTRPP